MRIVRLVLIEHTVCRLCQFGSCSGCQIGYIYDDVSVLHYDVICVKGINPARVGLILLDSSVKPLYWNSEALRTLAYPNQPSKAFQPNQGFCRPAMYEARNECEGHRGEAGEQRSHAER